MESGLGSLGALVPASLTQEVPLVLHDRVLDITRQHVTEQASAIPKLVT